MTFFEMTVDAEQKRFILFAGQADASAQVFQQPLRAAGLQPDAICEVKLVGPADGGTTHLSGAFLSFDGLRLPKAAPASMTVVEATRIGAADNA